MNTTSSLKGNTVDGRDLDGLAGKEGTDGYDWWEGSPEKDCSMLGRCVFFEASSILIVAWCCLSSRSSIICRPQELCQEEVLVWEQSQLELRVQQVLLPPCSLIWGVASLTCGWIATPSKWLQSARKWYRGFWNVLKQCCRRHPALPNCQRTLCSCHFFSASQQLFEHWDYNPTQCWWDRCSGLKKRKDLPHLGRFGSTDVGSRT